MGGSRWVIFDADNTLWNVEKLYDEARHAMCEFLRDRGIDPVKAERFQQERDGQLHRTYGYSACRFARSFEDTILHFRSEAPDEEVRHVRRLAIEVFEQRAEPAEGLEDVVRALNSAGYLIAIITAGERWVQERRLNDFHLRDQFAAMEIVESKNAEVFRHFCKQHQADSAASWMVGDSIRSDILPAREAGLRAVLLEARNWTRVEGDRQLLPPGVPVIGRLPELVELITPA